MSSALLRLRESSERFSSTERGVAERILSDPQMVVDLSIHELAQKTFSSPSTVVRMCSHTGFSGYKEFRRAVTLELAQREQTRRTEQQDIQHSDSLEQIIDKITYANILSLEETRDLMDLKVLHESVRLLQRAGVIYLFGLGASLCAAKDAYLKFMRLGKLCVINEDWHAQLVQSFNATAADAALVFSYSGVTAEMVECMRNLKKNGTAIIAITRCVQTPVYELAYYRLYTAANESLFRSGAMSSRMSQLNVVDILFTAFANSDYAHSLEQLSKTHIAKSERHEGRTNKEAAAR